MNTLTGYFGRIKPTRSCTLPLDWKKLVVSVIFFTLLVSIINRGSPKGVSVRYLWKAINWWLAYHGIILYGTWIDCILTAYTVYMFRCGRSWAGNIRLNMLFVKLSYRYNDVSMDRHLPHAIIIGQMKTGTRALLHYMKYHPDIALVTMTTYNYQNINTRAQLSSCLMTYDCHIIGFSIILSQDIPVRGTLLWLLLELLLARRKLVSRQDATNNKDSDNHRENPDIFPHFRCTRKYSCDERFHQTDPYMSGACGASCIGVCTVRQHASVLSVYCSEFWGLCEKYYKFNLLFYMYTYM